MALFEQFTVPCSTYLPSNGLATPECTTREEDTPGLFKIYSKYTKLGTPVPITVPNNGVSRIGKPSHGSSLDSISTHSAVVNVDDSQRFQLDTTSVVLSTRLEMIPGKDWSLNDRLSKCMQNPYVVEATRISSHGDFKGEVCEQMIQASLEGIQMSGKGHSVGNNVIAENKNAMEWTTQVRENMDRSPSAGGSHLNVVKGDSRNELALEVVQVKAPAQLKNDAQYNSESDGSPLEKPGVNSHDNESLLSAGDKVRTLLTIIKPKDVIQTVGGQQRFWKARRAILRQQKVFSEQVFALHKLIEVQKLMAKMPSTLMEEHFVARIASDSVGRDVYPLKMNSRKLEKNSKRVQDAPASNRCEREEHGSRHKRRLQATEGSRAWGIGASHKRPASSNDFPQVVPITSLCQTPHSSGGYGISAWGYPLASLNMSFFCPPAGAGRFPSGTGLGVAYPVNTSPPMVPYTFPCYDWQQMPVYYPISQCSNPVNCHPFFTPMANDWFSMNHPSHMPIASGSERLGQTHSVASINMRAEASSQSVQSAVIPLTWRQQVEKINHTRLTATKLYGSVAMAGTSTAPDAVSEKLEMGNAGEHNQASASNLHVGSGFAPTKMWEAFEGDQTRALARVREQSKGSKMEVTGALRDREPGRVNDVPLETNSLNLFPLQPVSSLPEGQVRRQGEGGHRGVIKAVPRSALAASESTAGILLSIQRERKV